MAAICRHAYVAGRVQGVGFRQSTMLQAWRLQLDGWVRNLPDGRVEVLFEGEEGAVGLMAQWLGQGPEGALVSSVTLQEQPVQGVRGFEVLL